jgi:hypothetical protein
MQRFVYERTPGGSIVAKPRRYTELATGMHYLDAKGEWQESKEEILPTSQGGAEAVRGGHHVQFPYDIYNGVIKILTPDRVQLKSRPLCISYFDGTNSCVIGELTNSVGQILASGNQVIYTNAFSDVSADLLCTYRKSGFECDLVFREQPPSPEEYGLNSSTSRLELLTEFFDTPEPRQLAPFVRRSSGLADTDTLGFGAMKMVRGKAFAVGSQSNQGGKRRKEIPVVKTWTHLEGRTFLIEEVPVQQIAPELRSLPAASDPSGGASGSGRSKGSASRILPPSRLVQANTNSVRMAKADVSGRTGVALDYTIVQTQVDNFTFQGDTTYYVANDVNLENTTIEGGAVIKHYTNAASINVLGNVTCLTAPYKPAVFTSFDDGAVGEPVSAPEPAPCIGSLTLSVQNTSYTDELQIYIYDDYGNYVANGDIIPASFNKDYVFYAGLGQHYSFDCYDTTTSNESYQDFWPAQQSDTIVVDENGNVSYSESGDSLCTPPATPTTAALTLARGGAIHDLRICSSDIGILSSMDYSVTNTQFVNCKTALETENASVYAGNVLMSRVGTAFYGQGFRGTCEQLTFDQGTNLTDDPDGAATTSSLALVNSLLTGVANYGIVPLTTNCVVTLSTNIGVFQTVGGGSYYLADNSPYRNCGINGIDSGLLLQLAHTTTYPPIVYSNATISDVTILAPQAQRDIDIPDLGYHYCPLDYAFGGSYVTTNLTFAPGTAVAWFRASGSDHGIRIADQRILTFDGHVDAPDYFVRYSTVQEGSTGNWAGGWGPGGIIGTANQNLQNISLSPEIHARFTRWSILSGYEGHFRDDYGYLIVRATDCEIYNSSAGGYGTSEYFTNCLIDRVGVGIGEGWTGNEMSYQNCTFHGGTLGITPWKTALPTSVSNCAFDGTIIDVNAADLVNPGFDYNAFTNGMTHFPTGGAHDVNVGDSFNWQTSWLGNYYLPSDSRLIDADTLITANQVGLYHYTTQVDQTKEGTSLLDIGYHYIAVNANGNPVDSDGDGVPDYLEDANGNGLVDSGETNWQDANDLGLKVIITRPKNNSILP